MVTPAFLTTMVASGVLVACGAGDSDDTDATIEPDDSGPTGDSGAQAGYTIVQRFPQTVQEPGALRLPISLSTSDAVLVQDGPATLEAQVADIDGAARRRAHQAGAARRRSRAPTTTSARPSQTPGVYYLVVDGGPAEGAAFQVDGARFGDGPRPGSRCRRSTRRPPTMPAASIRSARASPACPVPRRHAHRGVGGRQAGRLPRRHAGVLPDRHCAPALESIIDGPRASTATPTPSCTPRCTPTTPPPPSPPAVECGRAHATSRCCSSPTPPAS